MARFKANQRQTHRMDLVAAARLGPIMARREADGRTIVAPMAMKGVLWPLVNYGGVDGRAWPSRQTLAAEAETSVSTVRRVLQILQEEGFIKQVIERTRAKGSRKAESHDGATNVYVLDYDVLAKWSEDDGDDAQIAAHDEPRTRPTVSRVVEERGSPENRTRLTGDQNAALLSGPSKEVEPLGTVIEPSPLPPEGGEAGGGGEAPVPSGPEVASMLGEIMAAYPPSPHARPVSDAEAVQRAIGAERQRHDGCTPAEILAAVVEYAAALRSDGTREPLWCRTWMRERAYEPYVRRARLGVRDAAHGASPSDAAERRRLAEEAVVAQREAIDRRLAALSTEAFMALRRRAIEAQTSALARSVWMASEASSTALKAAMVELLDRDEADRRQAVAA